MGVSGWPGRDLTPLVVHRHADDISARLALTYQGSGSRRTWRSWRLPSQDPVILPCDVAKDEDLTAAGRW
jgi:hypothetical protein